MKYFKKIAASMLAVIAVTASSVPALEGFGAPAVCAVNTDYANFATYSYAKNVSPVPYRNCVKISWTAEDMADYYLIQICRTDGTKVSTVRAAKGETSVVYAYSALPLGRDINGKTVDTVYAVSVVAVTGNVIEENIVPFIDSSAQFTLKQDMSGYESYGAPKNIKAKCGQNSVTLSWENSASDGAYTNTFRVKLTDSAGKTVAYIDTKATSVTVNGLLYGNTYTAAITNVTYDAAVYASITVKPSETGSSVSVSGSETAQPIASASSSSVPVMEMPADLNNTAVLSSPKNLKAVSGVKKITLSWDKVSGADGYRVYIYDEAKQAYVRYKTVRSNRCTVTGLVGEKDYKFRVAGVVYNKSTGKYSPGYACKAITARSVGSGELHYVPAQNKYSE
ncbi:MAG: fibronectin type III domain-containing protein [Ruminococcus sp.]|nr:fibronectin type III domain-containing protein [Ruminococcus sp.]